MLGAVIGVIGERSVICRPAGDLHNRSKCYPLIIKTIKEDDLDEKRSYRIGIYT